MVGDADCLAGESVQKYNLKSSSLTNTKIIEAKMKKKIAMDMKLFNN